MTRTTGAVLCPRCRQLMSRAERVCPSCGAGNSAFQGAAVNLSRVFDVDLGWAVTALSGFFYLLSLILDPADLLKAPRGFDFLAPSGQALQALGMTSGEALLTGHVWTLFTASFLHGGLIHIVFNLIWLRQLTPVVRAHYGPAQYVVLFLLTGAGGFVLSDLASGAWTIGASASLFGLFGCLIGWGRRRGGTYGRQLTSTMWSWALPPFVLGFLMPGVNNYAHVGGFVTGFALAWLLPGEGRSEGRLIPALAILLCAFTVAGFGVSLWMYWPGLVGARG